MNSDTEILFPLRVLPTLGALRGEKWGELIDRLSSPQAEEVELIAFSLMMIRLGGCTACNADSFRAMRGCTHCARLSVKRYKSTDEDLIRLFNDACDEVAGYLKK
ncbi:MAG: hypothetical protein KBD67_08110 [Anaerolineaceae bacterium]|nr:hypothetical protein [Anaerolineaceae bacterium]